MTGGRPPLRWTGCQEPVDLDRIRAVERKAGVKLPETLVRAVLGCNGGNVEPEYFRVSLPKHGSEIWGFGPLLNFREPMDAELKRIRREDRDLWSQMDIAPWESIDDYFDDPPEHRPRGLFPLADNGCGDLLALDYRDPSRAEPPVVLWLHEESDEPPIFVAESFDALLAMLRPGEEIEA